MGSEVISLIGMLAALAFLIYMSYRGLSLPIVAICASAIILAVEYMLVPDSPGIMTSLKDTYMTGFVGFTKGYFLLLLFSTIFAQMMGESGAAQQIALTMTGLVKKAKGKEWFLTIMVMVAITLVLTAGGVSIFVVIFVLMPIAKSMFKEMDIPWHLFMCYCVGSSTATLGGLPGMPSITNIIPMEYLGTTPMAGPVLGVVASLLMVGGGCVYTWFAVRKAQRAGEGYAPTGNAIDNVEFSAGGADGVNFWLALVPPVVVLVALNLFGLSVESSMIAGIITCMVLFYKNLGGVGKVFRKVVGDATGQMAMMVLSTSAIVGFGSVASSTLGYQLAVRAMINMQLPAPFKVVIAVNVCAGLLGSSSGGLRVAMDNLAPEFLATGLDPGAIHRLGAIASGGLDSLPHASAIVVGLAACRLTYKQSYKHIFMVTCAIPFVVSFIMAALASMGMV